MKFQVYKFYSKLFFYIACPFHMQTVHLAEEILDLAITLLYDYGKDNSFGSNTIFTDEMFSAKASLFVMTDTDFIKSEIDSFMDRPLANVLSSIMEILTNYAKSPVIKNYLDL